MLRCKQVADALASSKYFDLPLYKRIGLRLHVALCLICGPFHRFIMLMQDATRHYREHELHDPPPNDMKLSKSARQRISGALKKDPS